MTLLEGPKRFYGVRWSQQGFSGVTTSRYIRFETLEECLDYCRRVMAKYREITKWPVEFEELGHGRRKEVREYRGIIG